MTNGWTERIATLEAALEQWKSLCAAQALGLRAKENRIAAMEKECDGCYVRKARDKAEAELVTANEEIALQENSLVEASVLVESLKAELAANAKMLARQCDLARQAEIERDGLRARLEAVVEISKSMKLLLILDDVDKWDRAVLLTIRQAIKKVGDDTRKDGHSALRWNKERQSLEPFDPNPTREATHEPK